MRFSVGDRVRVKPEYDEIAELLGPFGHPGTKPGTIVEIYDDDIIVAEDGSTAAPYKEYELEHIDE